MAQGDNSKRRESTRRYQNKKYAENPEFREDMKHRTQERYINMRTEAPWLLHLKAAKSRCNNPNRKDYKYYGGKGIRMLLTRAGITFLWIRDHADQMKRPSIDRINPHGDYSFRNCRFMELSGNISRK